MKSITQQLKRFTDDERAVSPVVGFVLMFALVMIVFTIYQAEVVPAQNAEVEFKHSQIVEGEMSQLNDAIQQAGSSGVPQSATIATGVQYPNRAFAINPGAPAGTLKTSDTPQTVTISGLSDGSGYWSSDTRPPLQTRLVSYQSNYNILQQETTYTLENGMFVKNFENGNTLLASDSSLISNGGQQINLVLVGGDYQNSAMTTSVTVTPVSTSTEYLRVQTEPSGGEISVPTTLPRSTWEDMLGNTYTDGIPNVKLNDHTNGDPGTVKIALQGGETFALRITKVTLGSSDPPELAYLKSEDPRDPDETIEATVGEPETFTVSARDEFGNPVVGATVSATIDSTLIDEVQTNDEGRATFTYTPTSDDAGTPVEIELSIEDGIEDYETVTYTLDVSDNSDNADDIGGDIDNGYALPSSRRVTIDSATADRDSVVFEFNNTGDVDMTATQIQFHGYVGHFPSSDFATGGRFADTDIELNGPKVTLNSPFTIEAGETTTATLSSLDANNVQTGLLIISVKYEYEYTEGGTTKTDTATATYSIPVLK